MLLALLALVSLAQPQVFQFVVRHLVVFEAWRAGGHASVARVEGSLFDPVVLVDSVWSFRGGSGAVARVEVRRVSADLAWTHLLKGNANRFFQRLSMSGVAARSSTTKSPYFPGEKLPISSSR